MSGLDSLHALLQEEVKDIYDAEKQLTRALPKLAKKASAVELKRAYGTVRAWANLLGKHEVASLLQHTLAEEKEADEKLIGIAEDMVNAAAAREDAKGDEDKDQHATGRTRASRARSTARAPRHQAADPGRSGRAVKRLRS